ncbi:MAG: AAA family ATPase [Succinivibrio sp.]|nr:AAA family ATPase [Succinivibrio sp.]
MSEENTASPQGLRLKKVEVFGLWGRQDIDLRLNDELSIIFSRNGSGKTTLLNLIYSVLTADLEKLFSLPLVHSVRLTFGTPEFGQVKILQALFQHHPLDDATSKASTSQGEEGGTGPEEDNLIYLKLEQHKFSFIRQDAEFRSPAQERRRTAYLNALKEELGLDVVKIVTVYRKNRFSFTGPEGYIFSMDREVSAVDERIKELAGEFRDYNDTLLKQIQQRWETFRQDVFRALLKAPFAKMAEADKNKDKYTDDDDITHSLRQFHKAMEALKLNTENDERLTAKFEGSYEEYMEARKNGAAGEVPGSAIFELFGKINALYEAAEQDNFAILRPAKRFFESLEHFLTREHFAKTVGLDRGDLKFYCLEKDPSGGMFVSGQALGFEQLSSGEKQLLIMFLEAILRHGSSQIFIIDEPEISLDLEWQHDLIEHIRLLNPNAQLIIATHAPELVNAHRNKLISLEKSFKDANKHGDN